MLGIWGTMPQAGLKNQPRFWPAGRRPRRPLDKQTFGALDARMIEHEGAVVALQRRQVMEFPYKHSTGEVIGRFLAGLKLQKKIWGQRVAGLGVVVPPLGYSEADGSAGGEWVEVAPTGVVTAVAIVRHPIERLHPFATPFAFVLVRLDGADTALAHVVQDNLDTLRVGARVEAVWAPDEARTGSIRDIACFRKIS